VGAFPTAFVGVVVVCRPGRHDGWLGESGGDHGHGRAGPVGIVRIGRIRRVGMALPLLFVARQLCAHDSRWSPQRLRHIPWEQSHTWLVCNLQFKCWVAIQIVTSLG
jgi:hypothetical protein